MCGVFGFVSSDGERTANMRRLVKIAAATERRGPHAWGLAWIDGRGRVRRFKQTGRITDDLSLLSMAADARVLIGHCRYATSGSPSENGNNHPHPADGGWIVHNGVVANDEDLLERHDLWQSTGCDSEVIGLMIEAMDGSLRSRFMAACKEIAGPAVVLGLWARPMRLLFGRHGKGRPLHVGTAGAGTYLASSRDHLPRNAMSVPAGTFVELQPGRKPRQIGASDHGQENAEAETDKARAKRRAKGSSPLFDRTPERVHAVPGDGGAAGPFTERSRRDYGF